MSSSRDSITRPVMASMYKTHTPQTDNTSFILKTIAMIYLPRGDGCESLKYHSHEGAVMDDVKGNLSVKPKVLFFLILSLFFLHFYLKDFINQDPHILILCSEPARRHRQSQADWLKPKSLGTVSDGEINSAKMDNHCPIPPVFCVSTFF